MQPLSHCLHSGMQQHHCSPEKEAKGSSPDQHIGLHPHDKLPQPGMHPAVPCPEVRFFGAGHLNLHAQSALTTLQEM